SLIVGPDGNLWFTENDSDRVGMVNPTSGQVIEYPTPTADSCPASIVVGPDGALWFTESGPNQIGRLDPATGAIAEFPIPAAPTNAIWSGGILIGPDGNLWFAEVGASTRIENINLTTHFITSFPIPPIVGSAEFNWLGTLTIGTD